MYRYAVCDKNGKVVNVIKWDGETRFSLPEGLQPIRGDTANIGDTYDFDKKEFVKPNLE